VLTLTLQSQGNLGLDFVADDQVLGWMPFLARFQNTSMAPSKNHFTWSFGDGDTLVSDSEYVTHTYLTEGLYDVTLMSEYFSTGCLDTTHKVEYVYCTEEITGFSTDKRQKIVVYPNPTRDLINIDAGTYEGKIDLKLHDIAGKVVLSETGKTLSMNRLENGTYLLEVYNANDYLPNIFRIVKI
jgi:hypothetical protein